jgi:hypothetical protein
MKRTTLLLGFVIASYFSASAQDTEKSHGKAGVTSIKSDTSKTDAPPVKARMEIKNDEQVPQGNKSNTDTPQKARTEGEPRKEE